MKELERQAIETSNSGGPIKLKLGVEGQILSVFENYVNILRQDNYLKGKIRNNALTGLPEVGGVYWDLAPHSINDNDLYMIRYYISKLYEIRNKDDIRQAVSIVASENTYHPIVELLKSLKWDGVQRIGALFPRYLGAERSEYTTAVTTLFLHGAIQRVFNPGVKFDYCLILADKNQGTGKSTMVRFMALNDLWYTDQLNNFSKLKDAFETIRGHWINELGEMLATKNTKDVESIKAYISRTSDGYRTPYGIYQNEYPRQCIFIGTSNKPHFLPNDPTGNRRFIPILCDGKRQEVHPLENETEAREFVKQCYAEAMAIGERDGWQLVLDRKYDEELEELREMSTPEETKEGMIQQFLDTCGLDMVCSRLIYDEVFNDLMCTKTAEGWELQEISDLMNLKITGWQRYRGQNGKGHDVKYRFKGKYERYGSQRAWQKITAVQEVQDAFSVE